MINMNRTPSDVARAMLEGAVDIHVHANPSLGPNCEGFGIDDMALMVLAREAGYKGLCVKNLEFSTVFRDYIVNSMEKSQGYGSCVYHSSITLNLPVGGINPYAVDFAIRHGARCVWLPTYSSEHTACQRGWGVFHEGDANDWHPAVRMRRPPHGKGLTILDEHNELIPEVLEVIAMTRDAEVCLATGHISPRESYALCKTAVGMGHTRVVLTHPDNPVTLVDRSLVGSLAKMGVYIEKTMWSHTHSFQHTRAFGHVRDFGSHRFVLTSDAGQKQFWNPVVALGLMVDEYLDNGFSKAELVHMVRETPTFLMHG